MICAQIMSVDILRVRCVCQGIITLYRHLMMRSRARFGIVFGALA